MSGNGILLQGQRGFIVFYGRVVWPIWDPMVPYLHLQIKRVLLQGQEKLIDLNDVVSIKYIVTALVIHNKVLPTCFDDIKLSFEHTIHVLKRS